MVMWVSLGEDLSEDAEEFGLLDLSVVGGVDGLDEVVDIILGGGVLGGVQVLHGSADEVVGLCVVEAAGVVLVELSEHGINGLSQLVVAISHLKSIISRAYLQLD